MKENKINIIFIIIFFSISILFFGRLLTGSNEYLLKENRTASQIPKFSIKSFLNGKYQQDLESGISDQILFSSELRIFSILLKNNLYNLKYNLSEKNGYELATNSYYRYNNHEWLVVKPVERSVFDENSENIDRLANYYNSLNIKNKFLYFISDDNSFNFDDSSLNKYIVEKIKKDYNTFKFDYLKVNNVEDYENYFYKTDHHWNYKGSYQGYQDIIKLIYGDDEKIIEPKNIKNFDLNYYGSKTRLSQYKYLKEKFSVYEFNIPNHTEYVTGEKTNYYEIPNNINLYYNNIDEIRNNWSWDTNHYAAYYGGDYDEVIYNYNREDRSNLLIIGSSFTNAINKLVASHFNKTFVIDLRYYKNFDFNEYVHENNIDTFLYIINVNMYINDWGAVDAFQ